MSAPAGRDRTRWAVPPGLWYALVSQLLAFMLLAVMGAWWTDKRIADTRRASDTALCELIDVILSNPAPPPAGPAGDRARAASALMRNWRGTLDCQDVQ